MNEQRIQARALMFLGTGSDVGKSVLAAAFCRIFKQDGYRVAPFKAQNMALNSFITPAGGEMGRAQVVQAEAAGLEPQVEMNPILLKPTSHMGSQVIVRGRSIGNFSARDYYDYKLRLLPVVRECYRSLAERFDIMVLEGAGSAVELNLKDHDLVNLAMAELADARCILVGDIDCGGIFAALLGSLMLMTDTERARVIGLMVNKLRGDPGLFTSGVEILEQRGGRPVLGVVPHFSHIAVAEEDSVALGARLARSAGAGARIDSGGPGDRPAIGVLRLPFVSNYTDFDCFEQDPQVDLVYFERAGQAFQFDAVILPGSKNTLEDLQFLRNSGLADVLVGYHQAGGVLIGICGGYQMLGRGIRDPRRVESDLDELPGLGLLDMVTEMAAEKITTQVEARTAAAVWAPAPVREHTEGGREGAEADREILSGYEIHMGRSTALGTEPVACFQVLRRNGRPVAPADAADGLMAADGRVWGTYIHGIFDNDNFRRRWLDWLRARSGKIGPAATTTDAFCYRSWKDEQYDLLADHVRRHTDVAAVYRLLGMRN